MAVVMSVADLATYLSAEGHTGLKGSSYKKLPNASKLLAHKVGMFKIVMPDDSVIYGKLPKGSSVDPNEAYDIYFFETERELPSRTEKKIVDDEIVVTKTDPIPAGTRFYRAVPTGTPFKKDLF